MKLYVLSCAIGLLEARLGSVVDPVGGRSALHHEVTGPVSANGPMRVVVGRDAIVRLPEPRSSWAHAER